MTIKMTNIKTKTEEEKPFIAKKPKSPFNADPFNNRGGKSGARGGQDKGSQKIKSISVPKFKGGSGGDR